MTDDEDPKYICCECIGESFLKNEIQSKDVRRKCAYCDELNESISLDELAEKVKYILDNFYTRTSTEPEGFEYAMNHDKESS